MKKTVLTIWMNRLMIWDLLMCTKMFSCLLHFIPLLPNAGVQRMQSDVRVSDKTNPLYCKKMEQYLTKYYVPFAPLWTGMLLGDLTRHQDQNKSSVSKEATHIVMEKGVTRCTDATQDQWQKIFKVDDTHGNWPIRLDAKLVKMFRNLNGRYRNFLDGTKQIGKKKKKQSITAAGATLQKGNENGDKEPKLRESLSMAEEK